MIVRSGTVAMLAHDQVGLAAAGNRRARRPPAGELGALYARLALTQPLRLVLLSEWHIQVHGGHPRIERYRSLSRRDPRRTAHPRTELSPVAER